MIDFINQYDDIRWDITQVKLDKGDLNNVTVNEFESCMFEFLKFLKVRAKIKTTSFPKCVRVDNSWNILLSNKGDIFIGNYFNSDIDNFKKIKDTITRNIDKRENFYYNYFYIPFSMVEL